MTLVAGPPSAIDVLRHTLIDIELALASRADARMFGTLNWVQLKSWVVILWEVCSFYFYSLMNSYDVYRLLAGEYNAPKLLMCAMVPG